MRQKINLIIVVMVLLSISSGCSRLKSDSEVANEKRIEKIVNRSRMFEARPDLLSEYGKIPEREKVSSEIQFKGKVLILRKLSDQEKLSVFPFQYDFMDEYLANNIDEIGTIFLEVMEDGSTDSKITNSTKSPTGIRRETKRSTNYYGWNIYAIDRAENMIVYKSFVSTKSITTTKTVDGEITSSISNGDELEQFYKELFVK